MIQNRESLQNSQDITNKQFSQTASGSDTSCNTALIRDTSENVLYAACALISMSQQKPTVAPKLLRLLTQSKSTVLPSSEYASSMSPVPTSSSSSTSSPNSSFASSSSSPSLGALSAIVMVNNNSKFNLTSTLKSADTTPSSSAALIMQHNSEEETPIPAAIVDSPSSSSSPTTTSKRAYKQCNKLSTVHDLKKCSMPTRQSKKYAPVAVKSDEFVFQAGQILLDFARPMYWLMVKPTTQHNTKLPYNSCLYKLTIRIDEGTGQCATKTMYFNSIYTKQYIMIQLASHGLCSLNYGEKTPKLYSLTECFGSKLVFPQQLATSVMFTDNHNTINVHLASDNDLYLIYIALRANALKTIELISGAYSCTLNQCCNNTNYKLCHDGIEIDLNFTIKDRIRNVRKRPKNPTILPTMVDGHSSSNSLNKTTNYLLCLIIKSNINSNDAQVQFFYLSSRFTRLEIMNAIFQYGRVRMPNETSLQPMCKSSVKFYMEKQLEVLDALIMRTNGDLISIYITEQLHRNEHYYNNLIGFSSFVYRDRPVFYVDE